MKDNQVTSHEGKTCPIQNLVSILSDAWTILILRSLFTAPKRFCELEKLLTGISTRTLTLKLVKLQEEGVIGHNEHLYSLTKQGEKLRPIIKEIEKVGKIF
jgi:DNA-binding HxlR family transcriptional regulator